MKKKFDSVRVVGFTWRLLVLGGGWGVTYFKTPPNAKVKPIEGFDF